jgi:UPF0042 nucleotide-binding protein
MSGLSDTPARELVILTGLSGSGKTLAVRSFEDSGYFCVDNLPVTLIPVFADLCAGARQDIRRAALVIDVREGDLLRAFPEVYRRLKAEPGRRMRLIFFEADDETLIRRFSETRRPHPLASGGGLQEHLTPATTAQAMVLTILSFGYKHGIPPESDLMFDTRFLPNPFFVPELRGRTGLDREVKEFLDALPEFGALRERLGSLLDFLIPHYMREGKSYLTAAIGCTGGRHRSVALAEALAGDLKARGYAVTAAHRDVDKE